MTDKPQSIQGQFFNVPNQLTTARLILSCVVFVLIPFHYYWSAIVVFVVAASTDWVDGYWARRYGQVTKLGRVFDPFVDKFIICGAFILLVAEPGSGVHAWMAVVVVGREMLVTSLLLFIVMWRIWKWHISVAMLVVVPPLAVTSVEQPAMKLDFALAFHSVGSGFW